MINWIIDVTLFPAFSCVAKLLPDIQSLPGPVNFACALIAPDEAFLRKFLIRIFWSEFSKDGEAD